MIFISNPFVLPLLVLVWSIDAWLWLASIRLILGQLPSFRSGSVCQCLKRLTDTLPQVMGLSVSRWTKKQMPSWLTWLVAVASLVMIRHLVLSFVIRFQQG